MIIPKNHNRGMLYGHYLKMHKTLFLNGNRTESFILLLQHEPEEGCGKQVLPVDTWKYLSKRHQNKLYQTMYFRGTQSTFLR